MAFSDTFLEALRLLVFPLPAAMASGSFSDPLVTSGGWRVPFHYSGPPAGDAFVFLPTGKVCFLFLLVKKGPWKVASVSTGFPKWSEDIFFMGRLTACVLSTGTGSLSLQFDFSSRSLGPPGMVTRSKFLSCSVLDGFHVLHR